MNICDTCPAPCCNYPVIVGPNSGTEQAIDWVMSEKGVFGGQESLEDFLERIKGELLRLSHPPLFFSDTAFPERKLQLSGIEINFDREMRIFFFRILFLCPEFNTETSRCNNYANRPKICRDFLCQDAGGSYESREKIEIIKSISEENFFHDIESTLVAIRRIIELDF